jgi:hypothetical protein
MSNRSESASGNPAPADREDKLITWALALAQLVSWGSVYYSFSLLVVPMEQTMSWSRTSNECGVVRRIACFRLCCLSHRPLD